MVRTTRGCVAVHLCGWQGVLKRTRIGFAGFLPQTEEFIPGGGSPRQDHVPRVLILANEYFLALESEFSPFQQECSEY